MNYLTRHLEALTDISHGRELVSTGKRFHATVVDADYYLTRNMAKEVAGESPKPAPVAPPAAVVPPASPDVAAPRRAGRPTNAERAARAEPPVLTQQLQTTGATAALTEGAQLSDTDTDTSA